MTPSQDRTPPQARQRWAAPGGGRISDGGPAAGGAAQAGNGPRRDSCDRYNFYLIYPPPRELNLHYRGGGQVPYHWARGGGD